MSDGLAVGIVVSHAIDPGSIPGRSLMINMCTTVGITQLYHVYISDSSMA